MAQSLSSIRNKLDVKIFSAFGSSATRYALDSETIDKWGDATTTYAAGTSIVAIPYDYIVSRLSYQPFGDLQENEVAIIVDYAQTIAESDKITYKGVDYLVTEIEDFPYSDGNIARAVKLVQMR